jgi:uncharacterized protein DUF6946
VTHFLIPTKGPSCWKQFLADETHWKAGYSAMALAQCWEEAKGFPPEIQKLLADHPRFKDLELLLAIPEHKVNLPGGRRPSQNDIFVLGKAGGELVSITIEGKVNESFDKTVAEWLRTDTKGKQKRLKFLREQLGLSETPPTIRYQLLHRTASAVIEAKRFTAKSAIMMVHSFNSDHVWFDDYKKFVELFGATAARAKLVHVQRIDDIDVYCGWATGDVRFLTDLSNENANNTASVS